MYIYATNRSMQSGLDPANISHAAYIYTDGGLTASQFQETRVPPDSRYIAGENDIMATASI